MNQGTNERMNKRTNEWMNFINAAKKCLEEGNLPANTGHLTNNKKGNYKTTMLYQWKDHWGESDRKKVTVLNTLTLSLQCLCQVILILLVTFWRWLKTSDQKETVVNFCNAVKFLHKITILQAKLQRLFLVVRPILLHVFQWVRSL